MEKISSRFGPEAEIYFFARSINQFLRVARQCEHNCPRDIMHGDRYTIESICRPKLKTIRIRKKIEQLGDLKNLRNLNLSDNIITSIDKLAFPLLQYLYLERN